MGNDWQDSSFQDRRRSGDARQRQTPQSSQSWENAPRQDGWPEARDYTTPPRGPANRPSTPMPPRQSGPQGGSGMLSRARNGGPSGPLPPRERSTRQMEPQFSGPLGPGSREMPPEPRRTRDLPPGDMYNEPTLASGGPGRRISAPRERSRNAGGGLLSFARAASNTMRAIITGNHRAMRPERPPAMMESAPAGFPGEETPRPHRRYEPYKRSRVRLVIHKRQERRQVRGKKLLISGIVSSFFLLLAVAASIYGGSNVYAFYGSTQKYLGALADPNGFPLTTRIYDRNGVLLYEMYDVPNSNDKNAAYRFYDQYGQIPQNLKNATVDIEDKTFWTNSGVDILGILRAGINDVSHTGGTQGGSTITQQLIKNAFFVDPNTGVAAETPQRKIQEALMAYAVTNKYSKQDLLEFYLNIIPYGYLSRGIEAAAQNMFSIVPKIDPKTNQYQTAAQQLDLAQAALLAGLPQNPTGYSPCGGSDNTLAARRTAALNRMHDVLNAMLSVGDIKQSQWNQADAESDVKDNGAKFFNCRQFGQKLAPHFVDYVIDQLAGMLTTDGTLNTGYEILAHAGLNVYTTLDYRLESYVEQDTAAHLYQPYDAYFSFEDSRQLGTFPALQDSSGCQWCLNIHDAATVVIDPRDGDILAMNGSGDYNNDNHDSYVDPATGVALSYDPREGGPYNAATSYRQPGSSFKPIVYAAAFEEGWSPATVLQNEWTCFPIRVQASSQSAPAQKACGGWYAPANYGFAFLDDSVSSPATVAPGVRVRSALDWSLNIPAVQALYFAGIDNVINLAHRMGLYADPTNDAFSDAGKGPSIALGSAGVRLLDMVDAYAVFANGGYHIPPRAILLVTDSQGNVIPGGDMRAVTATQVISPQTAFLITNILSDNAARTREFGPNSALYFGNAPYAAAKTGTTDDFKDNLTIGYTPYLAVGVWSGNANDEAMHTTIGITGAAPIWHDVMAKAYELYGFPADSYWQVPAGVNKYVVNGTTGLAPYQGTQGNYTDWFNDEDVPSVS
jgi:membrane peptidoglycan carboxypeptidase